MEWWSYPLVFLAGLGAGLINAMAGSGSLLTLPVLMLVGLPATVANGTNRLAMLTQAIASVLSYRRAGIRASGSSYWLVVPPGIGAIIGANLALSISDEILKWILVAIMLLMTVLLFVNTGRWLGGSSEADDRFVRNPLVWLVLFAIGLYAGFIQVGSNYFVLFLLVLWGGYDLHHANALKLVIQLCFTVLALPIFVLGGLVHWGLGLSCAGGSALGAWIGARLAVKRGVRFVRLLLVITVVVFTAKQLIEALI